MGKHGRKGEWLLSADAGFSMIEVVVALAIFLIVSLATVGVITNAEKAARANSDRIMAANIARSVVEEARTIGAANVTLGETSSTAGPQGEFSVVRTATWSGLSQEGSACDQASPSRQVLRVSVRVSGPNLGAPQEVDSIITPTELMDTSTSASLIVSVRDQSGTPVSGVLVSATDPLYAANAARFPLMSGQDGCLYLPDLTSPPAAPTTMTISVNRAGYVASTTGGASMHVPLVQGLTSHADFSYAPAATLRFSDADGSFPLPSTMPVVWQFNNTGEPQHLSTSGATVGDLWPMPTGVTAWAGSCADADPASAGGARQSFALGAGTTTLATLASAPVRVTGLAPGQAVTATYVGSDAACASTPRAVGVGGAQGVLEIGLPYGRWRLGAGSLTRTTPVLTPAVAAAGATVVAFG